MSNGMIDAKLQARQNMDPPPRTPAPPSPSPQTVPALDRILSHVLDNNSRIQDILANVQVFTNRALGEDTPASSATEVPQPQGVLGSIDNVLSIQTVLISELQEAVRVLERIG